MSAATEPGYPAGGGVGDGSAEGRSPRPTALITGASSGIGYELTKLFARDGYDLVLVASNQERLAKAADSLSTQGSVRTIAKNLSDPGTAHELFRKVPRVDVLVNNAGVGHYGPLLTQDLDRTVSMMRLNMLTLTVLTHLYLSGMVERRQGRILNVASTAAFQAGPDMAVYYASKAYVLHFSEAIATELHGSGVTVTCLCPGPTLSGFQARAGFQVGGWFRFAMVNAADVAAVGYRGMLQGRRIVIPGFWNRLLAFSTRFSPRALNAVMAQRAEQPPSRP